MQIFNDKSHATNLYTDNMEVDYRNYDVTLSNIVRVLTDRHPPGTARSKRLLSDAHSNVLLYITGHGGNEFMKIQARACTIRHCLLTALIVCWHLHGMIVGTRCRMRAWRMLQNGQVQMICFAPRLCVQTLCRSKTAAPGLQCTVLIAHRTWLTTCVLDFEEIHTLLI